MQLGSKGVGMAFATTTQYRAKYDTDLTDAALTVWLADASDIMADEMDNAGVDYDHPDESFAARLCRVCRDMVHRAIGDGSRATMGIPFGAKQASITAGSYSEQFTIDNPYVYDIGSVVIARSNSPISR